MIDGLNIYRYGRNNPALFIDPSGTETIPGFKPGTSNWEVGTRTDVQLYRYMQAMTPEQRAEFLSSTSGAFQTRARAFVDKYEMPVVVQLEEVTIEGEEPPPQEVILPESPGLQHLQQLTPSPKTSVSLGATNVNSIALGAVAASEAAFVVTATAVVTGPAIAEHRNSKRIQSVQEGSREGT